MCSPAAQSDTLENTHAIFIFLVYARKQRKRAEMFWVISYTLKKYTLIEIRAPNVVRYAKIGIRQLPLKEYAIHIFGNSGFQLNTIFFENPVVNCASAGFWIVIFLGVSWSGLCLLLRLYFSAMHFDYESSGTS